MPPGSPGFPQKSSPRPAMSSTSLYEKNPSSQTTNPLHHPSSTLFLRSHPFLILPLQIPPTNHLIYLQDQMYSHSLLLLLPQNLLLNNQPSLLSLQKQLLVSLPPQPHTRLLFISRRHWSLTSTKPSFILLRSLCPIQPDLSVFSVSEDVIKVTQSRLSLVVATLCIMSIRDLL